MESDSLDIGRGTGKEVPAKITQRIVLSHVSSVFDPLGLLTPFSQDESVAQRNLDETWESWDKKLSAEDEIAFKDWASELNHMNEMAIK